MSNEKPKRGVVLYYQAASVILLVTLVGFSISGLWGLVRVVFPTLTLSSYEWKGFSTLDGYVEKNYVQKDGGYVPLAGRDTTRYSLEQVKPKWEAARATLMEGERREGFQQILYWVIALVVCLPLYLYHHGFVRREARAAEHPGA